MVAVMEPNPRALVDLDALAIELRSAGYDDVRVRDDSITNDRRLFVIGGEAAIHVTDRGQVMTRSQSFRWARVTGVLSAFEIIRKHIEGAK